MAAAAAVETLHLAVVVAVAADQPEPELPLPVQMVLLAVHPAPQLRPEKARLALPRPMEGPPRLLEAAVKVAACLAVAAAVAAAPVVMEATAVTQAWAVAGVAAAELPTEAKAAIVCMVEPAVPVVAVLARLEM